MTRERTASCFVPMKPMMKILSSLSQVVSSGGLLLQEHIEKKQRLPFGLNREDAPSSVIGWPTSRGGGLDSRFFIRDNANPTGLSAPNDQNRKSRESALSPWSCFKNVVIRVGGWPCYPIN